MLKAKRYIALICAVLILFVVISGCGGKSKEPAATDNTSQVTDSTGSSGNDEQPAADQPEALTLPIVKDKITLKYWTPFGGWEAKTMSDNNEKGCYKDMEKLTNIHIEFLHPAEGQAQEQFNLMFTSNDLPDIIQGYTTTYPGGPDKAIADGYYLKLNDWIEKYAPNYYKLRNLAPDIAKETISDEGNIWCFQCVQPDHEVPWSGNLLRKDWLEELGLNVPETISEWYNVLSEFKNKKNIPFPLQWHPGSMWNGYYISAYGIGPDFYQDNGIVKYGYIQPQFKDWLLELNKWYNEGLLDKDFATRDGKSRDEIIVNGKSGAFENGGWSLYYNAIEKEGLGSFVAAPYPTLNKGENVRFRQADFHIKGGNAVITTSCKYPKEAVKWLDFSYSEQGFMLFNYGIENESYELVNGSLDIPDVWKTFIPDLWNSGKKPVFKENILNSPEGYDFYTAAMRYKVHIGPYLRNFRAVEREPDFFWNARYDTWFKAGFDMVLPPLSHTIEESTRYSEIMNEVNTYKDEMIIKFIMGLEPLDKYDQYVERIKGMDIEEAVKIKQTAFARYDKRQ